MLAAQVLFIWSVVKCAYRIFRCLPNNSSQMSFNLLILEIITSMQNFEHCINLNVVSLFRTTSFSMRSGHHVLKQRTFLIIIYKHIISYKQQFVTLYPVCSLQSQDPAGAFLRLGPFVLTRTFRQVQMMQVGIYGCRQVSRPRKQVTL